MNATKIGLTAERPSTPLVFVGDIRLAVHRDSATSYRVQVDHADSGAQVDELTHSWPTEAVARQVARDLYRAFYRGLSVEQVVTQLASVLDEALDVAFQGGDGTGRHSRHIPELDALRERLRTPGERAQRRERLAELADYLAGRRDEVPGDGSPSDPSPRPRTLAEQRLWNLQHIAQPARRRRTRAGAS